MSILVSYLISRFSYTLITSRILQMGLPVEGPQLYSLLAVTNIFITRRASRPHPRQFNVPKCEILNIVLILPRVVTDQITCFKMVFSENSEKRLSRLTKPLKKLIT
jgi:hypothetical protein